jgi:hypothetical protein
MTDGVSQSVSQYILVSSTIAGLVIRYYFLSECCCLKFSVLFMWGALSDERTVPHLRSSFLLFVSYIHLFPLILPYSLPIQFVCTFYIASFPILS